MVRRQEAGIASFQSSFPLRWSIAPGWIFEEGRRREAREQGGITHGGGRYLKKSIYQIQKIKNK